MTEAEYNAALKELDIVLLDVDYKQFNSVLDVAKFVISLNTINENVLTREKEQLKLQLKAAEERVDILSSKNIELSKRIEKMRNCQNCKNSCGNNCKLGSKDYFCNYDKWECR